MFNEVTTHQIIISTVEMYQEVQLIMCADIKGYTITLPLPTLRIISGTLSFEIRQIIRNAIHVCAYFAAYTGQSHASTHTHTHTHSKRSL